MKHIHGRRHSAQARTPSKQTVASSSLVPRSIPTTSVRCAHPRPRSLGSPRLRDCRSGRRHGRLCDIDRTEGALQLTNLKQRGPRRHVKLVYISRDLAGALTAFARDTRLGHDGHLFRSRQSGEGHLTRQQVLRIVNRLAVEAGVIVQGRTGPRPACGLDFRHGSAVHLLRSGVPLTEVQSHLGHARVDTTTVYLRLTNRDRRVIADRIDW